MPILFMGAGIFLTIGSTKNSEHRSYVKRLISKLLVKGLVTS